MEIKVLAKNTMILASPKVLKFFIGLLKSKFIAIFLGVTGFGIIDQLTNTITQIKNLSLSMLPHGMVKLIAKENADKVDIGEIANIIKTYSIMVLPLAVIITIIGYIFANELTIFVFGDLKYKLYFLIGFAALPITIFSTSIHGFFRAFKEIKSIAYAEFLIIVINLIIFLPLIYYYKIIGGVIYSTLAFFVTFFVIFTLVKKNIFVKYNITFEKLKNAVFSIVYFKELLRFIGVGIIIGIFRVFEDITIRSIVVNELGIDKLGIYSPITKWASLFVGFILPASFTYLFPRLSEAKNNRDITNVINDVIRLLTFVILPFIIIGISTRQWIIPLFFSNDFMEASLYLPYHFSALLVVIWSRILEQIFAPIGRLKPLMLFVIITSSISLILSYYLVPLYGLYGYMVRFTIIPLLTLIAYYLFWKREIKFRLKKENINVILYSIICCFILLFMKDLVVSLQLFSLLLILPLFLLLNQREKSYLIKKITKVFK